MKALLIFGARPNFMKVAPLYRAMQAGGVIEPVLVHTGQHFDQRMSDEFFQVLELTMTDVHLGVGAGSQTAQIAKMMQLLQDVYADVSPDMTVVVGDVSSTLAGALVSDIHGVPVAHVEAGLRSRDWTMPEERNRVLTDRLSSYLFTPSADGDANLIAEGIDPGRIHMVGNLMIDSLDWLQPRLAPERVRAEHGLTGDYGLVTLHRAGNVDDPDSLKRIVDALATVAQDIPLVFPVHPRTRQRLASFGLSLDEPGLLIVPPMSYLDFVSLLSEATLVLTDSGGIQEEATVLGVSCLTMRDNTERPITLEYGDNELVGSDPYRLVDAARERIARGRPAARRPPLWDGHAATRVVDILGR